MDRTSEKLTVFFEEPFLCGNLRAGVRRETVRMQSDLRRGADGRGSVPLSSR